MLEPSLFEPFIIRLERLGLRYFVTGSTAGILYGEPRLTNDVDIVVAMAARDVHAFVEAFPLEDFYCPPEEILAIEVGRGQRGHCNLIHHDTGFKADIYLAFDDLHRWALLHRRRLELDDYALFVAPPEYVILRKLEYFREGGSEKHLRDIRSMLEISEAHIDRVFLDAKIAELHLASEWKRVVDDR
ncbi:MAG: hypothetical protein H0T89_14490 [Deltaproteobacteria bacterium]|nr:hypothetical protein [Deltaproteobacteria bacterium]MDQ3296194.1 hypothetical protein [Myxococcota bacterium]